MRSKHRARELFSTATEEPEYGFTRLVSKFDFSVENSAPNMKFIIAVIQPTRLRAVKQALMHAGVERITICDSQEFAKHTDREPFYRGLEYRTDILRKITLEIAVNDDFLDRTIDVIEKVGRTGLHGTDGDGKIFVLPMEQAIQIDPEVRGPGAI